MPLLFCLNNKCVSIYIFDTASERQCHFIKQK